MPALNQIKSFLQIDHRIATAGQPSLHQLEALADVGYQVVINLGLHEAAYALEDEAAWVKQLGMKYIHLPVDFQQPVTNDFIRFLNSMNLQQDKRVFVHCAENKRVSVFIALYLVLTEQQNQIEGWNLILKIWEPNLVWESYYYESLNRLYRVKDEVES